MILLTGANGFIGSHLAKKLKCITVDKENCQYNGDLNDINFVNSLPDVDTVIHLAAFNSTKNFYSTPFSVIDSIITPTMNLLKRYPNAHFVYAGSSEEYAGTINMGWTEPPTPEDVPLSIEDITNPRWCYASGKIAMESAVISHSIQSSNTYTILRFHNIYGPGQQNHFIPEFIDRVLHGQYILYGYDNTRSFCHIDDAVELIKKTYNIPNEIINIGSTDELKILDVAHIIMQQLVKGVNLLELKPDPPGSTVRRLPDLTKLNSIVPNYQYKSMEQGIKEILDGIKGK